MENQRPLILVSNDDGIIAKGISELIKFLRPLGEIVVMAPDAPRSGSACALTVTEPIRYQFTNVPARRPTVSNWRFIQCSTVNPTLLWAALTMVTTLLSMCIIPVQWGSSSKAA